MNLDIFYSDQNREYSRKSIKYMLLIIFEYVFKISADFDEELIDPKIVADINNKHLDILYDNLSDQELLKTYVIYLSVLKEKDLLYRTLMTPCYFLRDEDDIPFAEYYMKQDDDIDRDIDDDTNNFWD